jgi:hypothetical protein
VGSHIRVAILIADKTDCRGKDRCQVISKGSVVHEYISMLRIYAPKTQNHNVWDKTATRKKKWKNPVFC